MNATHVLLHLSDFSSDQLGIMVFNMRKQLIISSAVSVGMLAFCGIRAASADIVFVTGADLVSARWTQTIPGVIGAGRWDGIDETKKNGDPDPDNGFKISWNISQDNDVAGFPWHYSYTISGYEATDLSRGLSHVILEISGKATQSDFDFGSATGIEFGTFENSGSSGSNPNLPADIYGIKFDGSSGTNVTFTFHSTKAPVWGNFYAKDGNNPTTTAWNTGLGGPAPTSSDAPFTNWIARPDGDGGDGGGGGEIPEPASIAGFGTLLAGFALVAVRRRRVPRRPSDR